MDTERVLLSYQLASGLAQSFAERDIRQQSHDCLSELARSIWLDEQTCLLWENDLWRS
jgi:hypothetical protein